LTAWGNFNAHYRNDGCGSGTDDRGHFSVRDGDERTIIVVDGDGTAVEPRVQRRANSGRRHEQPDGE
jgi:hypothetical protein